MNVVEAYIVPMLFKCPNSLLSVTDYLTGKYKVKVINKKTRLLR